MNLNGLVPFLYLCIAANVAYAETFTPSFKLDVKANQIKVMSLNLENAFDAQHDLDSKGLDKNDIQFLPKNFVDKKGRTKDTLCEILNKPKYVKYCKASDWTHKKYLQKLSQIKEAVQEQGKLPDILAVQEIENERVATDLRKILGYDAFLITEGPDKRGIDVGIFYNQEKLRFLSKKELALKGPQFKEKPTRPILQASFEIVGSSERSVLTVFVNHWPSQNNPNETRMIAAQKLKQFIRRSQKEVKRKTRVKKESHYLIALGDFNTVALDSPNPIHNVILSPKWKDALIDTQTYSYSEERKVSNPMRTYMAPQSYWYWKLNAWQAFDRILVSKNFFDGKKVELIPESFRIVSTKKLSEAFPAPQKENTEKKPHPLQKRYPFFEGCRSPPYRNAITFLPR